ncbi:Sulfite exporter TauE/SafE family protein [Perilla frutescens var. hirtella]|nr:Sulfite exporter TauE/SafE family protein [Perilla frutescens var. frutescens]KAH6776006.1 Sulfite exporter TauE/SafE family protein [Perilla frutescens var. hirtella]
MKHNKLEVMNHKLILTHVFLLIFSYTLFTSHAKPSLSISETLLFRQTLNSTHPPSLHGDFKPNLQFVVAGILSFFAAAVSSAGGIGGGGLFIPILTIVVGLDLKRASSYTAFMVTGGLIPSVASKLLARRRGGKPVIDYDIALLSEPCMLLGVSCGVICNLVLPEWLITIFFAIFLVFCTYKTFKSGISIWKRESEGKIENEAGTSQLPLSRNEEDDNDDGKLEFPIWLKLGLLVLIWLSFFVLYLLRGNGDGQGILNIEACGTGYWILSSIQIPLPLIFTAWIMFFLHNNAPTQEIRIHGVETRRTLSSMLFFPITALFVGLLGGVFGIGGGMIISPLLLEIGKEPEVTAATCSFMVFLSSIMSATQYLLLGIGHYLYDVLTYTAICVVASLVGLTVAQRAVKKYQRASLIVFTVAAGMALSLVLMTIYGVVQVWEDYTTGKSMGFNKPC